jgi:hypothetical protein
MIDIERQAHQQMEWGYFLLEHAPKSRLPAMLAALDAKAGDEIAIVGNVAYYRGTVIPVEDRDIAYLTDTSAERDEWRLGYSNSSMACSASAFRLASKSPICASNLAFSSTRSFGHSIE